MTFYLTPEVRKRMRKLATDLDEQVENLELSADEVVEQYNELMENYMKQMSPKRILWLLDKADEMERLKELQ